jgi:3' terminal RNA ribose 2'-O-methyltransferase Hen1
MFLTLSTTHRPATDLGYLLHKHPGRVQAFAQSFGVANVFFPEATETRCTAALVLDVDPVGLVRRMHEGGGDQAPLDQYVNDRPYVASSFLAVALADIFRTALAGRCKERPDLVAAELPLEAVIGVLRCRGGEGFLRGLFEPLGYAVEARRLLLDPVFPEWGESAYFNVTLRATKRLSELLGHLYVLIPVLDNDKHYWVGTDEVEKLLRNAGDWLGRHPLKEQIARRYLRHKRALTRLALERLVVEDSDETDEDEIAPAAQREVVLEERVSLNRQRMQAVSSLLLERGVTSVVDLGCGEGRLLAELFRQRQFRRLLGVDVSIRSLERAAERLKLDRLSDTQRSRIQLLQGSLTYRDQRLEGYEAATAVEVIEHLDPHRLAAFQRVLFEGVRAPFVLVTTPNVDYNVKFEGLPPGQLRHSDHRFEWTRAEFSDWAHAQAMRYGYAVRFLPIGEVDERLGPPTQMAVFERREAA